MSKSVTHRSITSSSKRTDQSQRPSLWARFCCQATKENDGTGHRKISATAVLVLTQRCFSLYFGENDHKVGVRFTFGASSSVQSIGISVAQCWVTFDQWTSASSKGTMSKTVGLCEWVVLSINCSNAQTPVGCDPQKQRDLVHWDLPEALKFVCSI